ncbi:MAG: protein phosphatase CheZ [Syntrophobacteraceae bacterium]|nr:protein phosphatase CheZ [Syntrophobacteraceae bacterium]
MQSGKETAGIDVGEVMEILGVTSPSDVEGTICEDDLPPESVLDAVEATMPSVDELSLTEHIFKDDGAGTHSPVLGRLEQTVGQLGGEVSLEPVGEDSNSIVIRFPGSPEVIEQIETLLSIGVPQGLFAPQISQSGAKFDKVLGAIKEFMMALSNGNCNDAQGILLNLAEQQQQAGLYNEIGGLARELHNSLKNFMETMDPHIREMVEERIPDTGNRLEHILELTENAANTTIDHVEAIQRRNELEQKGIDELERIVSKLTAIGDQAHDRVLKGQEILAEIRESLKKNHDDLIVVLTAQDYQDLTGQIILKIIQLLNDLELKLVNVIRTFGMKSEEKKESKVEELYGPAHKARADALHSQDDVDGLLAEFGF